jgi:choline dehydrogenase-like flavoprotein
MTLAVVFRDRPVERVTPRGFEYALAEAGLARLPADGGPHHVRGRGPRVFFNSHQPLILNTPEEIDAVLTLDLVRQQRILITRGHPMGGCALGGGATRDVVDSRGRSRDVDGLYVADSSILS